MELVDRSWSVEALAAGARDAGLPSVAHGMLERGAADLVDFFMDDCNEQLRARLAASADQLQAMAVADRVKFGVRARLELLEPVLATWPQAMAIGALPQNAPSTMKKLATMADDIWYYAGDQSSDASWYTKRAVLTAVYASTELFLLSDHSPGFQDTWAFLDRRVDETIALGELPRNVRSQIGKRSRGSGKLTSSLAERCRGDGYDRPPVHLLGGHVACWPARRPNCCQLAACERAEPDLCRRKHRAALYRIHTRRRFPAEPA